MDTDSDDVDHVQPLLSIMGHPDSTVWYQWYGMCYGMAYMVWHGVVPLAYNMAYHMAWYDGIAWYDMDDRIWQKIISKSPADCSGDLFGTDSAADLVDAKIERCSKLFVSGQHRIRCPSCPKKNLEIGQRIDLNRQNRFWLVGMVSALVKEHDIHF